MQSNYLDKLSAHSPIEDSRYKSWEESRVAVYRSTSFEALIMDIYNLTHSPSTILRFPLDGDWILTDKDGDQYKVRFMAGQTNMLDAIKESPDYVSYLGKHPEDKSLPLAEIAQRIKFDIIGFQINDLSIARAVRLIRNKEIILNKHAPIYPTKTIDDPLLLC